VAEISREVLANLSLPHIRRGDAGQCSTIARPDMQSLIKQKRERVADGTLVGMKHETAYQLS
jgi:hypothetical protein